MTEQKAIQNSIKHWREMIQWVTEQDPRDKIDQFLMEEAIDSTWFDKDCDLCSEFNSPCCFNCPLQKAFGKCGKVETNAWTRFHQKGTWEEWLVMAEKMLKQLESLIQPTKAEALRAIHDEAGVAFDALFLVRQDLLNQLNQAEYEEASDKDE